MANFLLKNQPYARNPELSTNRKAHTKLRSIHFKSPAFKETAEVRITSLIPAGLACQDVFY